MVVVYAIDQNSSAVVAILSLVLKLKFNLPSEIMDDTCVECRRTLNRSKQPLSTHSDEI